MDESQAVGLPLRSGARCEWSRTRTPSEFAIGGVGAFICKDRKRAKCFIIIDGGQLRKESSRIGSERVIEICSKAARLDRCFADAIPPSWDGGSGRRGASSPCSST